MNTTDQTEEQALAEIESYGSGPFLLPQCVADKCIEQYGRLPSNCMVMPRMLITAAPPVPVFSLQPFRGAQWKRERAGRRS